MISLNKSKVFLVLSLSFIGGIGTSSFFYPRILEEFYFFAVLAAALIFLIVFYKSKAVWLIVFCLVFFLGGAWLTADRLQKARHTNLNQKTFSADAVIMKEPEKKDRLQKIIFQAEKQGEFFGQKFLATVGAYPEYAYGDRLRINCVLEIPENKDGKFDYRMYLAKDGIYYLCKSFKAEILEGKNQNVFFGFIFKIKNKFQENINKLFPSPQSGLLSGLLLGGDDELPESTKEAFSQTGMTHIIAVSGYNVTIIAEYLIWLGIFLGLWRKQAFWLAILGISLFILMIGFPSSALRAGVMGTLLLWAMKNGRLANSRNAIVFAAAVMLAINPLLLRWDIGFQLSFLATLGIIYFYPILENRLVKEHKMLGIKELIFLTISAQIFVVPIILVNFEKISLISLLANLLVLPIIPLTMLLGFLAPLFYFLFPPLGEVIAWLAFLPLKYEVAVINFLAGLRFSAMEIKNFPWWGVVVWYIILAWAIIFFKKRKNNSETELDL